MRDRTCPECGKVFTPKAYNGVCCSDECKKARRKRLNREAWSRNKGGRVYKDDELESERVQRRTLAEERKEKARRRAAFFAARDAAFERAGLPIPKIVVRDGVVTERRGMCVGTAAGALDTSVAHAMAFI